MLFDSFLDELEKISSAKLRLAGRAPRNMMMGSPKITKMSVPPKSVRGFDPRPPQAKSPRVTKFRGTDDYRSIISPADRSSPDHVSFLSDKAISRRISEIGREDMRRMRSLSGGPIGMLNPLGMLLAGVATVASSPQKELKALKSALKERNAAKALRLQKQKREAAARAAAAKLQQRTRGLQAEAKLKKDLPGGLRDASERYRSRMRSKGYGKYLA